MLGCTDGWITSIWLPFVRTRSYSSGGASRRSTTRGAWLARWAALWWGGCGMSSWGPAGVGPVSGWRPESGRAGPRRTWRTMRQWMSSGLRGVLPSARTLQHSLAPAPGVMLGASCFPRHLARHPDRHRAHCCAHGPARLRPELDALRRAGRAGDVLREQPGALAHEGDRIRLGAHGLASRAAGRVGGARQTGMTVLEVIA